MMIMMIKMIMMIILMILMVMINMNKDLLRTFVQPTAWRKNRDYVLYYHNWSWTVVTGANFDCSVSLICDNQSINQYLQNTQTRTVNIYVLMYVCMNCDMCVI